jgi:hypothetical protein
MSSLDSTIKQLIYNQNSTGNDCDTMFNIDMARGKRVKRTIDANRTNQNYKRSVVINTPLLEHYENVDWYERDTQFDLDPYIDRA